MNDAYLRARKLVRLHIVVLSAVLLVGMAVIFLYRPSHRQAPPSQELPRPLAQGRQVYTVFGGGTGPKITEVVVDPFDPAPGNRQMMEIKASHTNSDPVISANLVLFTDTSSSSYPLVLASGDGTSGTWRAEWTAAGTHLTTYSAIFSAFTARASSSIELNFR